MPSRDASAEDFLFSFNQALGESQTRAATGRDSSTLAGLNAFSDDADSDPNANAAWQEQLALWTNASFSFDGPTGHALLLDEEKDHRSCGSGSGDRAQGSSRGLGALDENINGTANAPVDSQHPTSASAHDRAPNDDEPTRALEPIHALEPTHQDHKLQSDNLQQSQYFAPPSSNATEGRRPGRKLSVCDEGSRRHAENDSLPDAVPNAGHSEAPQNLSIGQNPFSAFSLGNHTPPSDRQEPSQPSSQPFLQQQSQLLAAFGLPFNVAQLSPEFMQALAFQQIFSESQDYSPNPFALAAFMSMGAFDSALAATTAVSAPNGPDIPPHSGAPKAVAPDYFPPGSAPWQPKNNTRRTSVSAASSGRSRKETKVSKSNKKRRQSQLNTEDASADEDSTAGKGVSAQCLGRATRDEIPLLQLIDTGNPDADAEANRLAIEEDKRRRNTAASARFRIKKKQREQALERTTKELECRVRELEESNSTLERENGWLKSLIHVRYGHPLVFPHGIPVGATFSGFSVQPQRDTGLQPRGIGTTNGMRTFEDFQRTQPSATAAGNRASED